MSANLICRSVCGVHSAHVTGVAEEVRVQREALSAGLVGELFAALLQGGGETEIKVLECFYYSLNFLTGGATMDSKM